MGDSHRVVPPRSGVGHPLVHQRALDRFRVTRGGPPDPQLPSILHGGRTSSSAPAAGVPPPRVHRAIGGHSDAVTARGHGYRLGRSQPALHEPGKAHHALPSHARPPYAPGVDVPLRLVGELRGAVKSPVERALPPILLILTYLWVLRLPFLVLGPELLFPPGARGHAKAVAVILRQRARDDGAEACGCQKEGAHCGCGRG
mmetsp:Transcript_57943/g.183920  ORF Transcript_57943/g.183920 Transcript_57943/m.183920 type:complete len:201 (+) Transcript_57943:2453-3055(+)